MRIYQPKAPGVSAHDATNCPRSEECGMTLPERLQPLEVEIRATLEDLIEQGLVERTADGVRLTQLGWRQL